MAAAIEVRDISKRFRLSHERYSSLKERVIHFGRVPYEDFWALSDIDFDVEEGTTVGLLGHNGSGKSTLLKCVAGILQPTRGEIVTRGRVAALLELGAGFHPELTGRENIYLNASILGLSKRDTDKIYDDIVEFAELERFIDMQVRHYSSGMYVRLGFAVAVNVQPDILLVDEVLAVGDEAFQRKCLDRVAKIQRDGRTILLVTHAADLVRKVCDRAIVLDHGNMVIDASPGEAVRSFREHLAFNETGLSAPPLESELEGAAPVADETPLDPNAPVPVADPNVAVEGGAPGEAIFEYRAHGQRLSKRATHRIRITSVQFDHPGIAQSRTWLLPDEHLTIRVAYDAAEDTDDVLFGIAIFDEEGNHLFGTNTTIEDSPVVVGKGQGEVAFDFTRVPVLDGTFFVTLACQTRDEGVVYDWLEQEFSFSVMNPSRRVGLVAFPVTIKSSGPAPQS